MNTSDPFMWAVADPAPEQSLLRIKYLLDRALGDGGLYPYTANDYFRAAQQVAHDAMNPLRKSP